MAKLSVHRSDVTRFHRYVPARGDPGFEANFPKFIRNLIGQGFTLREGPAFFEVHDQLRGDA